MLNIEILMFNHGSENQLSYLWTVLNSLICLSLNRVSYTIYVKRSVCMYRLMSCFVTLFC